RGLRRLGTSADHLCGHRAACGDRYPSILTGDTAVDPGTVLRTVNRLWWCPHFPSDLVAFLLLQRSLRTRTTSGHFGVYRRRSGHGIPVSCLARAAPGPFGRRAGDRDCELSLGVASRPDLPPGGTCERR